jgi:hypothetical protein
MRWLLAAVLAAVVACAEPEPTIVSETDAGIVLHAQAISVAFNAANKTQVETSKMFLVLNGYHKVPLGVRATIRTMSNGRECLCFEGPENKRCPTLW